MKRLITFSIILSFTTSAIAIHKKSRLITHLPNIEVYDLKGRHTTLSALGKNKVMIIDNWFIPCPPCFREMGMLHKLYFKYRLDKNICFITICRTDTGIVKLFLTNNKSVRGFVEMYHHESKRSDFKLPIYFIPGCNEKIYTGKPLASYAPDDKTKCTDVQFGFKGYPTLMIFDKKGNRIFKKTGFSLNEGDQVAYAAKIDGIIGSAAK